MLGLASMKQILLITPILLIMIAKQILLTIAGQKGLKDLPDGADVVADLFLAAEVGPVPDLIDGCLS